MKSKYLENPGERQLYRFRPIALVPRILLIDLYREVGGSPLQEHSKQSCLPYHTIPFLQHDRKQRAILLVLDPIVESGKVSLGSRIGLSY